MKRMILCAIASAVAVSPVAAQQLMTVGGAAPAQPTLRAGTDIPLKTRAELTTEGKKLKAGDRFDMEVSEPVSLGGQVVIPAGSRAIGEIVAIRNKGMWGKSGNIDARVLYVITNNRQLRVSGAVNDKGKTGTAGVVGAIALVPVAGFFMTGTSARIPAGTQVIGHLDEDVSVAFAAGAGPQPMTVAAAPAAIEPAIVPAALVKQ